MKLQLVKHTATTRDCMRIDLDRELLVDGYRIHGDDRPGVADLEFRPAMVLEWNIPRQELHFAEAIAVRAGTNWRIHSLVGFSVRAKYDGAGSPSISKHDLVTIGPRGYYLLKEMLEAAKGRPGGVRVNPSARMRVNPSARIVTEDSKAITVVRSKTIGTITYEGLGAVSRVAATSGRKDVAKKIISNIESAVRQFYAKTKWKPTKLYVRFHNDNNDPKDKLTPMGIAWALTPALRDSALREAGSTWKRWVFGKYPAEAKMHAEYRMVSFHVDNFGKEEVKVFKHVALHEINHHYTDEHRGDDFKSSGGSHDRVFCDNLRAVDQFVTNDEMCEFYYSATEAAEVKKADLKKNAKRKNPVDPSVAEMEKIQFAPLPKGGIRG